MNGITLPSGQRYNIDNSFPTDFIIYNLSNVYVSIDPSNLETDRVFVVGNNGVFDEVDFNKLFSVSESGNIELYTDGAGIILSSPNGTKYIITVDNSGNLITGVVS